MNTGTYVDTRTSSAFLWTAPFHFSGGNWKFRSWKSFIHPRISINQIYVSLALVRMCLCWLLPSLPLSCQALATICLTDRLDGTSLRYPVALVCCCITNDCGIFISIINLIYVAAAPAAFIVRIINAPQKSLLDPTRPGLLSGPSSPGIEVIYYFYTFHVFVRHALSTLYNIRDIVRKLQRLLLIFITAFFVGFSRFGLQIVIYRREYAFINFFETNSGPVASQRQNITKPDSILFMAGSTNSRKLFVLHFNFP